MLGDEESYILHTATGKMVKLRRKGNVLVMKLRIVPPEDRRRGQDGRRSDACVLGEVGFTGQGD